jgi:hypothetical protein
VLVPSLVRRWCGAGAVAGALHLKQ